ncbi:MAG: sigma-70 family RNA polymerase sigma factor [Opitutales bacterium]
MTPEDPDLEKALQRVKRGDLDAYEEIVCAYYPRVRAFLYQRCPYPDVVDETAHETFIWVFDHLDRYQIGTRFGSWVISVAHFKLKAALEASRRRSRNQKNWFEDVQLHQEDPVEGREDEMLAQRLKTLEHCLEKLPTRAAELIRMRYWSKLPFDHLADRLKQSAASLRVTLHRTRAVLRDCMEQNLSATGEESS